MSGELILRCDPTSTVWYDAYDAFRLSLEDGALATLMAYPPMKEDIRNESRLEHGTRHTDISPKLAEREFAIPVHISAKRNAAYVSTNEIGVGYYYQFLNFLSNGWIDIWVKSLNGGHTAPRANDIIFRCKYRSCTQFRQTTHNNQGIAVFSLSLIEPNPNNRTLDANGIVNQSY